MKYFRFILRFSITFITLVITKSYQYNFSSLSPDCSTAVQNFLNSSDFNSCFPYNQLSNQIDYFANIQDLSGIESKIIGVEDSICKLPKCSDSVISNFNSTFHSKCSTDIAAKRTDALSISALIYEYSPLRDSLCFKNSTGGYCLIETFENFLKDGGNYANLSSQVLCTTCNKAIINTWVNYIKSHPPPPELSTEFDVGFTYVNSEVNKTYGKVPISANSQSSNGLTIFDINFAMLTASILMSFIFYF
ncbi:2181_t:CDS:2 [Cetraspora pellucida]|uniref:2181_t:CDS:1 n=1 Tax=Cetraspora pellucida TaxID=1433469 RepID=A0A9N9FF30_9GLOM|nr:2181_t:CDS:2 [Cetraspora pellucida]